MTTPLIAPADSTLLARQQALLLDWTFSQELFKDSLDSALWAPELAAKRLALGPVVGSHPFERCISAANHGRARALEILLDMGFAPSPAPEGPRDERDFDWHDLVVACAHRGMLGSIELLATRASIDTPNIAGFTPLMMVAVEGMDEVGLLLLRLGANPHARSEDGNIPLMSAAIGDCPGLATALLALGADPRADDDDRGSAIDYAHHHESARFLAALDEHELLAHTPQASPGRRPGL